MTDTHDIPEPVKALIQAIFQDIHKSSQVDKNAYEAHKLTEYAAMNDTLKALFVINLSTPEFLQDVSALRSRDLPMPEAGTRENELVRLLIQTHCHGTIVKVVDGGGILTLTDSEDEADKIASYMAIVEALEYFDKRILQAILNVVGVTV